MLPLMLLIVVMVTRRILWKKHVICIYILFFKKQYAIEGQSIYFLLPIGIFALITHIFAGIIGLYIRNIGRVEWCFSIGCCILYASFFGKSTFVSKGQVGSICKVGIKFLLILFCMYEFYYMLNNGGSGQVPYVLFGEFRWVLANLLKVQFGMLVAVL